MSDIGEDQRFDFSPSAIPTSWHEAASDAPEGSEGPLKQPAPMRTMPTGRSLDMFTALLAGAVTCLIGGYAWIQVEMSTGRLFPWSAVALGAAIAIAVRLGGGQPDHELRAAISFGFYVAALVVVLFLIGRTDYIHLFGSSPGWLDFEQHLFHSRLTGRGTVSAWLVGALISIQLSYYLRHRR